MYIEEINLENFRNYDKQNIKNAMMIISSI